MEVPAELVGNNRNRELVGNTRNGELVGNTLSDKHEGRRMKRGNFFSPFKTSIFEFFQASEIHAAMSDTTRIPMSQKPTKNKKNTNAIALNKLTIL